MRIDGWESRLLYALQENRKFEWGACDCCLFAADIVRGISGVDPAEKFRGKYKSKRGADRIISRLGGLRAAISAQLGDEIIPNLAMRGDVVLLNNAGREVVGVVNLSGQISAMGETGVVTLPINDAICAWRV